MSGTPGGESMFLELEAHRDACVECTLKPWTVCAVAAKLLQRMTSELAEQLAPAPSAPVSE